MISFVVIESGDDVAIQAIEETSGSQPFGTGRKLVREVIVIRGNEKFAGFGGLGQRPDPGTERGIITNVVPVPVALAALCFQERSIPASPARWVNIRVPLLAGSVNHSQDGAMRVGNKSDYGTDYTKPNLVKGLN